MTTFFLFRKWSPILCALWFYKNSRTHTRPPFCRSPFQKRTPCRTITRFIKFFSVLCNTNLHTLSVRNTVTHTCICVSFLFLNVLNRVVLAERERERTALDEKRWTRHRYVHTHVGNKKKLITFVNHAVSVTLLFRCVTTTTTTRGGGGWASSYSFMSSSSCCHDSSTHVFTRLLYSLRFSLNSCAASELAGELGFGSQSKDWTEVRIADIS